MRAVAVVVIALVACGKHADKPAKPYVLTYTCKEPGVRQGLKTLAIRVDLTDRGIHRSDATIAVLDEGFYRMEHIEGGHETTTELDTKAVAQWRSAIENLVRGAPYKDEPAEDDAETCELVVAAGDKTLLDVNKSALRERDPANAMIVDLRKDDGTSFVVTARCGAVETAVDVTAKKRTLNDGVAPRFEALDDRERLVIDNAVRAVIAVPEKVRSYGTDANAPCSLTIRNADEEVVAVAGLSSDRDDALGRLIRLVTRIPESPAPLPTKPYLVRYQCRSWQGWSHETRYDLATNTRVDASTQARGEPPHTSSRRLTNHELRGLVPAIEKLVVEGPHVYRGGAADAETCTFVVEVTGTEVFKLDWLGGDEGPEQLKGLR